jgi:hypothetical protein
MKNITWVSLGESCISQDIINSLGIKTIVSPYSWAFSSIDHIINLQEEEFAIDDYCQTTCPVLQEKYSVHKTSKNNNDSFFVETGKSLAFRHHDFFSNNEDYETIKRRMDRYKSLNSNDVVFLYNYRIGQTKENEYVRSRLEYFLTKYYPKAKALMFYEVKSEQRGIDLIEDKNNVFEFKLKTTISYEDNLGAWQREPDRDLHKQMLDYVLTNM